MTRLTYIEELYAASGLIGGAESVIELVAVADQVGASLDRAVRELSRGIREDGIDFLGELLAVARQLRWRMSVEPFPVPHAPHRADLVAELRGRAGQCRFMVARQMRWILDDLVRSADAVISDVTPPLGHALLQSLRDVGFTRSVMVASGHKAAEGVRSWFKELDVPFPVVNDREPIRAEIYNRAYFIGAPPVFGPVAFGAPRAWNLAYLFPSWVQDRALPRAEFSIYAHGIDPRPSLRRIGHEAVIPERLRDAGDQLIPEPVWRRTKPRLPAEEGKVHARRVLLCGGLSIMLDLEGDLIRTLDPVRPAGERVKMRDVAAVGPGTYLVLREGQSESGPLYARALTQIAAQAKSVEATQSAWKAALRQQLRILGSAGVVRKLHALGVGAAAQAPTWIVQTLARPRAEADFAILLDWLGLPLEPYCQHANLLNRARSKAMADVRDALEAALGDADMPGLERSGFLKLDLGLEGFAGIVATRVLAISPYLEVVPRSDLRIPKEDASARWLE